MQEAEVGEHHHAPARPEEAGLPSVLDVIPHKANNLNTNNNPKVGSITPHCKTRTDGY